MTRRFCPLIRDHGGGVIIKVIGLAVVLVDPNYMAGSGGNASLIGFSHTMGAHALEDGMRGLMPSSGPVQSERIVTILKTRPEDARASREGR